MYADDLVIFSPYSAGLQKLLKVCSQYCHDFDINAKKSKIMMVRTREDRQAAFPDFYLAGTVLSVCSLITYCIKGHIISDDLSDDKDIYRQWRKIGMCLVYCRPVVSI